VLWAIFMVFAIREPKRRGKAYANGAKPKSLPVSHVFLYMWENFRTFAAVIGGHSMKYLFALGTTAWMPTLFVREFGWDLTTIGIVQGCIIMAVGPIGLVLGGKLSEYLTKKGVPGANMRIVFYGMLLTIPLSMAFPLMPMPWLVLTLYALNLFISGLGSGPATAAAQVITPNAMRAQISAVKLFSSNVIAFALGPLIVALFTDYLFNDPQQLKYSMSLAAVVLGPPAILIVWQGLRPYAELYDKTAAEFED
jgi:sugar phosphate permease